MIDVTGFIIGWLVGLLIMLPIGYKHISWWILRVSVFIFMVGCVFLINHITRKKKV